MDRFEEVRRRARHARLHPSAPTDGAEAFRQGRRCNENPYHRTDPDYERWHEAWLEARERVT